MPETIKAAELPMVGIFNNNYRFEIPDYQRPYSWTTEQAGELLDDLLYASRRSEKLADASPYFLGSIVIIKSDNSPLAEIVDGQQRITTLTILLCALRDFAGDNSDEIEGYIRTPDKPLAGIEGHFRLSVRERDRRFFEDNIQKTGKLPDFLNNANADLPDSRQRMFENAKHLWSELTKLDETSRNVLAGFIVQRCYLVVVSTSDQDSAYRIFSVLNDRGLDLSPTDILKAQIVGGMEDESKQSDYAETWEDIEDELGRDDFRSLFAHIRMIYMKDKARRELNKEFQESVLKGLKGEDFIDDVLTPYADAYEKVALQSIDGLDDVNLYLGHLGRLDNSDWIPPAMEFFKRNGDSNIHLQFIKDLERLAYGMFIRRADINQRIRRYADILRAIERGDELFEEGPLQLSDDEKSEVLRTLNGPVYSLPRVPRPLLLRLDSILAGAGASYNHKIISVEHVLPQHPQENSKWFEWFPDEEIRKQWTHRLANLVLLSHRKNSQANNREFKHKKITYFRRDSKRTPFVLTNEVIDESKWTPKILKRRQKALIKAFKKEWRLS